ncbi:MAG: hypothetical protein ABIF09_00615 [Gemmatimonadota bacterium]
MIFLDREKSGPDRYLDWKVRLFFVGALLALAGIGLESSLLVGLATLALVLGLAFRLLPSGDRGGEAGECNEGETSHEAKDPNSPPSDHSPLQR